MLSAPCINNTNTFLVLKSYIASRVQSIKRSTQGGGTKLYNILRFETIYENCGFPETAKVDRKLRKRIRDTTKEYLEYLVGIGSLKSFQCLDDQNIEQTELKNCTKFLILY